ncbi:hypothetical protein DB346_17490 [Verrucomicrobia bacterium LW23]|nr:hypothetical protein DB346_17490 [Verrucomicrobia bacterium LW23]
MRILYLYPEEWTGRRAREVHTLRTCVALAGAGASVHLLTAGGMDLPQELLRLGLTLAETAAASERLSSTAISRRFGPLKSAWFFRRRFAPWLAQQQRGAQPFDAAFIIHLKAAAMLNGSLTTLPYVFEAHEVFAETPAPGSASLREVEMLERRVLSEAAGVIATSQALARALSSRYFAATKAPRFHIIAHGGAEPVELGSGNAGTGSAEGPFVYAGSLGDWKGLDIAMEALLLLDAQSLTRATRLPELRIIGGNRDEWERLRDTVLSRLPGTVRAGAGERLHWHPRVAGADLPQHLAGTRAGLIPTLPETGSGRYSCPMKLYDYARMGLPVVATDLPSLQSLALDRGDAASGGAPVWCIRVTEPSVAAWKAALLAVPAGEEAARCRPAILAWARRNTWAQRGLRLLAAMEGMGVGRRSAAPS